MSLALVVIGVALVVAGLVVLLLQPARARTPEAHMREPSTPVPSRDMPRDAPHRESRPQPRIEPPVVLTGAPWPTTSGESLPLELPTRAPVAPARPAASPRDAVRLRLTVTAAAGGSRAERVVTLHDRHVAGRRAPDEALRFPDDACMSARHCELSVEAGAVMLRDLDSSNGTIVNGVPVLAGQRYRLDDGDRIRIGDTELMVAFLQER